MITNYDPFEEFNQAVADVRNGWLGEHGPMIERLDVAMERLQELRDLSLLNLIAMGETHAEIAAYLGVSRQAVSQQVAHARKRLRQRAIDRRANR